MNEGKSLVVLSCSQFVFIESFDFFEALFNHKTHNVAANIQLNKDFFSSILGFLVCLDFVAGLFSFAAVDLNSFKSDILNSSKTLLNALGSVVHNLPICIS